MDYEQLSWDYWNALQKLARGRTHGSLRVRRALAKLDDPDIAYARWVRSMNPGEPAGSNGVPDEPGVISITARADK